MSQNLSAFAAYKGGATKAGKNSGKRGAGHQKLGRASKEAREMNGNRDTSSSDSSKLKAVLKSKMLKKKQHKKQQKVQTLSSESQEDVDVYHKHNYKNKQNGESSSYNDSVSENSNSDVNTSKDTSSSFNASNASDNSTKTSMELKNNSNDSGPGCSVNCVAASGKRRSNYTIPSDFFNYEPPSPKRVRSEGHKKDKSGTAARKSLPAAVKPCPLSAKPKEIAKAFKQSLPKISPLPPSAAAKSCPLDGRPEVPIQNSIEEGKRILDWILSPASVDVFFKDYWEQNACLISRKNPKYFADLVSLRLIDDLLMRNHLEFTTNIDVTSYTNGVRETHNPEGRATAPTVWGYYEDGCSVRILNPSSYLQGLRNVCSTLQEFFHCLVGANVYLTPPNSQGFAPHYDDIEAFVLQVEGRKRWRLYMPPLASDVLARESSGNYQQEQLGEPIFDEVLNPGDVLYFPRGTVHQAITMKNQHSLHITLSVYQKQSYADLMEKLMPMVLQQAIKSNLNLRRGLPLNTWRHAGLVHGNSQTEKRADFVRNVQNLATDCLVPSTKQIDAAVDQLAKRFQHEALPLIIHPEEKKRTVYGSRSEADANGNCLCDYELTVQTSVRLLRANVLRLVAEDGKKRIYYYVDNGLEYCKYDANFMEIKTAEVAAVEKLIHAYPAYTTISQLPLSNEKKKVEVATALWERGLLMTEKPFK